MTIPDDLRMAISEAERRLALEPHGALELCCRQGIWTALGPRRAFGPGHRRRTNLEVFCVRRILPAWEKLRPEDDMLQCVLQAIEDYMAGTLDRKAARKLGDKAWTHSDGKAKDRAIQRVIMACYAAARALYRATANDKPGRMDVDSSVTDSMLDAYSWDTGYSVCRYVAGRVGWPDDDIGRRRQYWRWYIHEAAPMAWQSERGDE